MKNIFTKTALSAALLMCASVSQAAIQDVAINGGFETGTFNDGSVNASWQEFPNNGVLSIVTSNTASGTYAANLNVPIREQQSPAVDALIKNANLGAGSLTAGAPVTITWDMRGSLEGAGGVIFVELFSELAGGGTSKAEIYTGGPLAPNNSWTSYIWNTTLGNDVAGGVTLQLKASCGPVEGCGVDAYFDNISITTDVSAVPVPAAAWLFGSALLGLGGIARKKKAA
jgi:hypothetical protein